MYTEEQKRRIKNSVFSLPTEKREKILRLVALVSEEPDDDMQFDVMVAYMDKGSDKELEKALKQAQAGGFQFEEVEEIRDSIPKKVKISDK